MMTKRIKFIIAILLIIVILGIGVAVVYGDKIYRYQVDIQLASQKLSQTNMIESGGDPSLITQRTTDIQYK